MVDQKSIEQDEGFFLPPGAVPLRFGLAEQIEAYDRHGSNCGPGAIAGVCGFTPFEVLDVMPEFQKRRATTEIMLRAAMTSLGVNWKEVPAGTPVAYGISRVQWDGPWISDPDPYEKLRHSHWVGECRYAGRHAIFDHNAISVGGWLSFEEWDGHLRPWLLEHAEPEAPGGWWISETYEVLR